MDIPEHILSDLRTLVEANSPRKFRGAEVADDGILVISTGDSVRKRDGDFKAYVYYGPYGDDDRRAVYASNYGNGVNIRETARNFRNFLTEEKKAIVAKLEKEGFVIRGWEEDYSYRQESDR